MRAALFYGVEKGLEIGSQPIPAPKEGDILVKIAAAGLCHSDLVTLSGQQKPKEGYPIIPGHEGESGRPFRHTLQIMLTEDFKQAGWLKRLDLESKASRLETA